MAASLTWICASIECVLNGENSFLSDHASGPDKLAALERWPEISMV